MFYVESTPVYPIIHKRLSRHWRKYFLTGRPKAELFDQSSLRTRILLASAKQDDESSDTISAITIFDCIKLYFYIYISTISRRFNEMQDTNNMALFLFHTAMRWAAVRLDTLSLMVVFATSLFVTFMPSDVIPPAYAALALSYAMNVSNAWICSWVLGPV